MASITEYLLSQLSFPSYVIEIGVLADGSVRKVKVGVNNAELMFIHENGSPLHNIPARPVLQMTIEWANKSKLIENTLDKCIKLFAYKHDVKQIDAEMDKLCIKLQNYARKIIYANDGRLAPNSPSVAKRKKGNHPLFDTGQLARSITCRAVRIEKGGTK